MNRICRHLMVTKASKMFAREIPIISTWLWDNGFRFAAGSTHTGPGKYAITLTRNRKRYSLILWYGTEYDNYIVVDADERGSNWNYVAMIWKGGELHADLLGSEIGQYLTYEECLPKEAR